MTVQDAQGRARHASGSPASQGGRWATKDTPDPAVSLDGRGEECSEGCGRPADSSEHDGLCQACADDIICRRCGGRNDDGEGWDGLCGDCADQDDLERRCNRCDETASYLSTGNICDSCMEELEGQENRLDTVEETFAKHFPGTTALELYATPGDVPDGLYFETGIVTVVYQDGRREDVGVFEGERPQSVDQELLDALEDIADVRYAADPTESQRYRAPGEGSTAALLIPFKSRR